MKDAWFSTAVQKIKGETEQEYTADLFMLNKFSKETSSADKTWIFLSFEIGAGYS